MNLRSWPACALEAHADLNAFDGLDRHHRARQATIQLGVVRHVAAEAGGQAPHNHLEDAPKRIALFLGLVDGRDHEGGRRLVQRAER